MAVFTVNAQKYDTFQSDFAILDKSVFVNDSVSNALIIGKISYELAANKLKYDVSFPEQGQWLLRDSTLLVTKSDTSYSVVSSNELNAQSIFQNFLRPQSEDFGLSDLGFTKSKVEKIDNTIFVEWSPPQGYDAFLESVLTKIVENNLVSIIFFDVNGDSLNATYFDDYKYIDGLAIPRSIKSKFKASQVQKFKTITLSNVSIY